MADKPLLILDQHFRRLEELFRPETYARLSALCRIEGGQNWPMDPDRVAALIEEATLYVAAMPKLTGAQIARAKNLRAVIEVAGGFNAGLDYTACFDRGIEVLSCAPGFRESVSEMTLAMVLAAARGLVDEHEAFRTGAERWLDDREDRDFSLFGETVGFIGYGQIARETHRLMAPFRPRVLVNDPFLAPGEPGVHSVSLEHLVQKARVIIVAAVPSEETRGLLSADLIARMRPGALVVVISRAWCTDFPALVDAARAGRIRLATDVFPVEPVAPEDPIRTAPNILMSPHRAAAVPGGRHLIGEMVLHDVAALLDGRPERQLKPASPDSVASLVAAQVGMAAQ